jgi:limonene-1,2-epoxide hydrolase
MRRRAGGGIVPVMPQLDPLPGRSSSPRPVPDAAHVELSPETAAAVATVHAWEQAFRERDLDRLLALSAPDIELATRNGASRGHDAIRRLLHLQSYGVAQHVRARRYHARAATIVVEALIELRWVDSGELAETTHGVAVFDVRRHRVSRFRPQPDLASAFDFAGWSGQPRQSAPTSSPTR